MLQLSQYQPAKNINDEEEEEAILTCKILAVCSQRLGQPILTSTPSSNNFQPAHFTSPPFTSSGDPSKSRYSLSPFQSSIHHPPIPIQVYLNPASPAPETFYTVILPVEAGASVDTVASPPITLIGPVE